MSVYSEAKKTNKKQKKRKTTHSQHDHKIRTTSSNLNVLNQANVSRWRSREGSLLGGAMTPNDSSKEQTIQDIKDSNRGKNQNGSRDEIKGRGGLPKRLNADEEAAIGRG